jgi:trehalose synthase
LPGGELRVESAAGTPPGAAGGLPRVREVQMAPLVPGRFRSVLGAEQAAEFDEAVGRAAAALAGRVVWNVNSTAAGGGVAEMLRSLIAYGRGAGVDARWVVIDGNPEFFRVTKRIHNRLHGEPGDSGTLGARERAVYESVTSAAALALAPMIRPGDLVLLHDPQTAGMTEALRATGAHLIWRCHVGMDVPNRLARSAWRFLLRYVAQAEAQVFSREAFAWQDLEPERLAIIPPSIDAFSPKNQPMTQGAVTAILYAAGLARRSGNGTPTFERHDGSPGRVDRRAEMFEDAPLHADLPVVAQVSRWDRLKDPLGVIDAFVAHVAPRTQAHLVLGGPDVTAVSDDPEGIEVLREAIARRDGLAPETRARVHLAALPMDDAEENAAIVNALQRRAAVVVQKSLAEGFGLTVAEAMWKSRPVVATRVGGIQDQIVDGESGFLVAPQDLERFGDRIAGLLGDEAAAARMGAAAQARVRNSFLGPRHLIQYLDLFGRIIAAAD